MKKHQCKPENAGKPQQSFTVVGLFPDSEWDNSMWDASFVEHVHADSPKQAAKAASLEATRKRLLGKKPNEMATDEEIAELAGNIETLAIFKGHHRDVYDFNARNED